MPPSRGRQTVESGSKFPRMCLIGIRHIGAAYLVYVFSWVEYWSRSAGGVDQPPSLMLINPIRSESMSTTVDLKSGVLSLDLPEDDGLRV